MSPRAAYWNVRWAIWGFREHLFVRLLSQQMRNINTLYVHPDPKSGPFAAVRMINPRTGNVAPEEPHGHAEGSEKYELIPVYDPSEIPVFEDEDAKARYWETHECTDLFWAAADRT